MPVAIALADITRLIDKVARDFPRNIDIAALRYAVHQLASAAMKQRETDPLIAALTRKRSRRQRWARQKRAQRARARSATAHCE